MLKKSPAGSRGRTAFRAAWIGGIAALMLLVPTTAHAANGGDPAVGSPSCDTQSVSPHNTTLLYDPANGAYMGKAYLNYSSGCKTEWTIVKTATGYRGDPSIWLQSGGGNLTVTPTSGLRTRWSYQLANMQYQVGCGGVQMYRDNGSWVNWYPIGCY
ncbi:hypothetical protein ACWER9_12765 [Micromonospora sp. NPDC003944]